MVNYKVSTNIVVPVVLTDATSGLPHTGVAAASVSVTVIKASGATATYTPSGAQWTEYSADAFVGSGYYNLTIPSGDTDVVGILQYGVKVTGDDLYFGTVDIVANLESDTIAVIGTPANVTVSQDIADVETKLGTPANVTVSQDIADVETKLGTPANVTVSQDIADVEAKLGTPANVTVSQDIADVRGIDNRDLSEVYTAVTSLDFTPITSALARIQALSYDNVNQDQQVYDAGKRLTSARFRAYNSAANALAGGGAGLLYTYTIAATYDVDGNCTSFIMTRN